MGSGELAVEGLLIQIFPFVLEVGDPGRTDDERRAVAGDRVREPAPAELQEADVLRHV